MSRSLAGLGFKAPCATSGMKPIHAAFSQKRSVFSEVAGDFRVVPVQVRLLRRKVQVPLARVAVRLRNGSRPARRTPTPSCSAAAPVSPRLSRKK